MRKYFFLINTIKPSSVQFNSVTQSCPTLCDPMNHSKSGLPSITNSRSLPKLMSIESVMPSNHLILCHPLLLLPSIFPRSGSFPMSRLFASGGQNIGVSASTSVLPMNTQDWSPLGWTGWISLQSKGLSRVFSNTTVQKHHFFCTQLSFSFINTWTMKFQRFKLVLEKAEKPEIKLPTSTGSSKKQENSRKTSISALLTMPKPLTLWITPTCGKFWKRCEYQTIWPASWETYMQVRKQ